MSALWDAVRPEGYMADSHQSCAIPNRISGSCEGRGKLRLFLKGNYVKQRLLHPFHLWFMAVLRRLPGDGWNV